MKCHNVTMSHVTIRERGVAGKARDRKWKMEGHAAGGRGSNGSKGSKGSRVWAGAEPMEDVRCEAGAKKANG